MRFEERIQHSRMILPEGKWILVFRNGDVFYPGAKVLVNPAKTKNFDNLLNDITEKLDPIFGAVRQIFTPVHGTSVQDLIELKHNHKYVAAGVERFRHVPGGYKTVSERTPRVARKMITRPGRRMPLVYLEDQQKVEPVVHSRVRTAARYKAVTEHRRNCITTIFVFSNGDHYTPPTKFVLTYKDLQCWDRTMEHMGRKLNLLYGGLKALCRLTGEIVKGPSDLKHGEFYVAVGDHENFKSLDYLSKSRPTSGLSGTSMLTFRKKRPSVPAPSFSRPRFSITAARSRKDSAYNTEEDEEDQSPTPSDRSDDRAAFTLLGSSKLSHRSRSSKSLSSPRPPRRLVRRDTPAPNTLKAAIRSQQATSSVSSVGGSDVFRAPSRRSIESQIVEVDYDQDHGGIFRARRKNSATVNAREIKESPETIVDLPIDFQEAQEVKTRRR